MSTLSRVLGPPPPVQVAPFIKETDLVSDLPGITPVQDANLVNPWGIASSPTGPFWVADNRTGVSTLYDGSGHPAALVVTVPTPSKSPPGTVAAPTGMVFNGTGDFVVSNSPVAGSAIFIFATEDGTISGYSPVSYTFYPNPYYHLPPTTYNVGIVLAVDNSGSGTVYKGLALASSWNGPQLYATDFHGAKIDVFNKNFKPVTLAPGAFTDPNIPSGYAPFGIANVGRNLVVTYALQNAAKHDDVAGAGHGFVDVYTPNGVLLQRVAAGGTLNSPWGITLSPAGFGRYGNDLLIGNFGDGRINAYHSVGGTYQPVGQVTTGSPGALGRPISIPGLWGLKFGSNQGAPNTLYFTAGIPGPGGHVEDHGLFGSLKPSFS